MRAVARNSVSPLPPKAATTAAEAYNDVGDDYLAYADGDPRQIYAFGGQYAYGDRYLWSVLDSKLTALRATGATSINILDAGCGPGTWLRRLVTRARALGFTDIRARGFDVADAQIRRARDHARALQDLAGVDLRFEVADIGQPFPEPDASVDLTLCLYCVLNHLPDEVLPNVVGEIARVTRGAFVTTVRAVGSSPTIYVEGIDQARTFRQDHASGRFQVELQDGRRMTFNSRLYAAADLRGLVNPYLDVEAVRGLDLFHTRFAHDPRWNPSWLADNNGFRNELVRLEEQYGSDPDFIDHAAHLLLVARARPALADRH
ncbi:MAG TPA: class I SAM-dependent methyltransferase [Alphaproteobacteria bacterium]